MENVRSKKIYRSRQVSSYLGNGVDIKYNNLDGSNSSHNNENNRNNRSKMNDIFNE